MGLSKTSVLASLRFSLGRYSRAEDVDHLLRILPSILLKMMDVPETIAREALSCAH